MHDIDYGVIGGSGFYNMPGFIKSEEMTLKTPFGDPSDVFVLGDLDGKKVAFLARHGRSHTILPSEINFRANIYGMKLLGVRAIISASAVGSLREEIHPGEMVVPDQLFDRTRHRPDTFFGEGIVAHVSFAKPFCAHLRQKLLNSLMKHGIPFHQSGTYICMEGPQFSTRAESNLYKAWGMSIIGMTNLQEAKLAREAEICYATMALVTDYDCWHPVEEEVKIENVLAIMKQNTANAQKVIAEVIQKDHLDGCECHQALRNAIVTPKAKWPMETYHRLRPLLERWEEQNGK
jgi:5'-methylthioadenosine phosphorylase